MKAISVYMYKGGVGKSFISENLAIRLANRGLKVLAIDFDQQGNLTEHFGIDFYDENQDGIHTLMNKVIGNERITKAVIDRCIVRPTYNKKVMVKPRMPYADVQVEYGIDLIPMNMLFINTVLPLENSPEAIKGTFLFRVMSQIEQFYDYDYVVIDCPPAFGTLSANALYLNNGHILMPVKGFDSARGAEKLVPILMTVGESAVRNGVNWGGPLGIILNNFIKRDVGDQNVYNSREDLFKGYYIFDSVIPHYSEAEQAIGGNVILSIKNKDTRDMFDQVANEVINRINSTEEVK